MADLKISQLTGATTPLAGTEVLPIVQSSSTKKVATDDLTVKNVRSNATTGILQVAGPAAAATRTMTVPDANFTAARTDAAQTFTGVQTFSTTITGPSGGQINGFTSYRSSGGSASSPGDASIYFNAATGYTLQARAGSSYDWSLINPGNANYILRVPTGTVDMEMAGGNLAFSTAAKGVNFTANTPAAGMTSQLLNWYEEGTWTFTLFDAATGGNASPTTATGYYTRVGRLVTCSVFTVTNIDTTGMTAGNRLFFSLPFSASLMGSGAAQLSQFVFGASAFVTPVINNASRGFFAITTNNNTTNNIVVSNLTSGQSDIQYFTLTYQI